MSLVASKKYRRATALLALPLLQAVPGVAWAQDAGSSASDEPLSETSAGSGNPLPVPGRNAVPQGGGLIRTFIGGPDPLGGGLIRTFGGDIEPYVGRIRTFNGDVDPLGGGLIRTFAGEIDPQGGGLIRTFEGVVDPQGGGLIRTFNGVILANGGGLIRTFAGDVDPFGGGLIRTFWGSLTPSQQGQDPKVALIRTYSDSFVTLNRETQDIWSQSEASGDYAPLLAKLAGVEQAAASSWGAAVQAKTGKSFSAGFTQPFFAKWNVNLADAQTLAGWTPLDRQRMMLDWYDNTMLHSGMDRADYWMNLVNWSPTLTQNQGGGSRAIIGLMDFFTADADVRSKVIYSGGYQNIQNAHGAAVGSLLVASHDGKGVMGIAPRAQIAAFNPFDESHTASWTDVRAGIAALGKRGASVVNLSLGLPRSVLPTEWRDVFRNPTVQAFKDQTVYVIAAGNDGIAQSSNIEMKGALDSTFLLVGSVDPNGLLSGFSNVPASACITVDGQCRNTAAWNETDAIFRGSDYLKESGLLMNRFLVAPGEMILVSDGEGGVTRVSGTSFAAPLVSGAIALIQDRWPWLKQKPREVAKIILESAQDLGAEGVDQVYGHGLLDIEAAQSPLDFGKLKYYLTDANSRIQEVGVQQLRQNGVESAWSAQDLFFVAFEDLGTTERDFLIPLSSRLFGSSVYGLPFQEFAYNGLTKWLGQASYTAGFSDSTSVPAFAIGDGWTMAMRGRTQTAPSAAGERMTLVSSVELSKPESGIAFGFGTGDGAVALGGASALQRSGDFDPYSGGANPLLGFASGDAHVSARYAVSRKLDVSVGVTRQDQGMEQDIASGRFAPGDRVLLSGMDGYHSQATMARLDYRPARPLTLSVTYTRLAEEGAFFGVRSLNRADFGENTVSDGVSLAADAQLGGGLSLFASGTMSRSNSQGEAAFGIDEAMSTAFQAGFAKQALFGSGDHLRVTLAQPLTVERGHMDMKMVGVVDRETGAKGLITQRVSIGAPERRRYRMEAFYGTDLMEGVGSLGLFGTAELRETSAEVPGFTVGGNMRLAF